MMLGARLGTRSANVRRIVGKINCRHRAFQEQRSERRMWTKYPFKKAGQKKSAPKIGVGCGARKSAQLEGTTKPIAETFTGHDVYRLAH